MSNQEGEWLFQASLIDIKGNQWMSSEETFTNIESAISNLGERIEAYSFVIDEPQKVIVEKHFRMLEVVELDEDQQKLASQILKSS